MSMANDMFRTVCELGLCTQKVTQLKIKLKKSGCIRL